MRARCVIWGIGEGTLASEDYVFAVSDGMGGAKSGEFASKIATEKITKLLPKSFKQSAQGLASGFTDLRRGVVRYNSQGTHRDGSLV